MNEYRKASIRVGRAYQSNLPPLLSAEERRNETKEYCRYSGLINDEDDDDEDEDSDTENQHEVSLSMKFISAFPEEEDWDWKTYTKHSRKRKRNQRKINGPRPCYTEWDDDSMYEEFEDDEDIEEDDTRELRTNFNDNLSDSELNNSAASGDESSNEGLPPKGLPEPKRFRFYLPDQPRGQCTSGIMANYPTLLGEESKHSIVIAENTRKHTKSTKRKNTSSSSRRNITEIEDSSSDSNSTPISLRRSTRRKKRGNLDSDGEAYSRNRPHMRMQDSKSVRKPPTVDLTGSNNNNNHPPPLQNRILHNPRIAQETAAAATVVSHQNGFQSGRSTAKYRHRSSNQQSSLSSSSSTSSSNRSNYSARNRNAVVNEKATKSSSSSKTSKELPNATLSTLKPPPLHLIRPPPSSNTQSKTKEVALRGRSGKSNRRTIKIDLLSTSTSTDSQLQRQVKNGGQSNHRRNINTNVNLRSTKLKHNHKTLKKSSRNPQTHANATRSRRQIVDVTSPD